MKHLGIGANFDIIYTSTANSGGPPARDVSEHPSSKIPRASPRIRTFSSETPIVLLPGTQYIESDYPCEKGHITCPLTPSAVTSL
jgi:hypothetical protein